MNSDALYFPSNGMLNPQIVDTGNFKDFKISY